MTYKGQHLREKKGTGQIYTQTHTVIKKTQFSMAINTLKNKRETSCYSEHTPDKNLIVVLPLKHSTWIIRNKTDKTVSDS